MHDKLRADFDAQAAELALAKEERDSQQRVAIQAMQERNEARALLQAIRNAPTKRCAAFFCDIDAFLEEGQ